MPITDNFTDPDGTTLIAHGGWTEVTGTWTIQSNKAQCGAFVIGKALRIEAAFPNDQYVQSVVQAVTGQGTQDGVILRSTILIYCSELTGSTQVEVYDSGGFLATYVAVIGLDTPFTLKATVTGTTVETFVNGVSKGTTTTVDTSGKPGIRSYTNGTQPFIEDFECSDASAGSAGYLLVKN